ncbi:hypothetical protein B0H14DRAFT_2811155 [Mycena olivaceomarginata]|nr:hypothetical protein B0H14DRAFT_2811155 [Mycena olivaceomarginata]
MVNTFVLLVAALVASTTARPVAKRNFDFTNGTGDLTLGDIFSLEADIASGATTLSGASPAEATQAQIDAQKNVAAKQAADAARASIVASIAAAESAAGINSDVIAATVSAASAAAAARAAKEVIDNQFGDKEGVEDDEDGIDDVNASSGAAAFAGVPI